MQFEFSLLILFRSRSMGKLLVIAVATFFCKGLRLDSTQVKRRLNKKVVADEPTLNGNAEGNASEALASAPVDVRDDTENSAPVRGIEYYKPIVKVFGTNWGNRFIPEEWMDPTWDNGNLLFQGVDAKGSEPGHSKTRLSLADLDETQFRERYFTNYLNHWIQKSDDLIQKSDDFDEMARMLGRDVNVVVRVPCGYWNWVDRSPNGPEEDEARRRVLQSVPSKDYRKYFDLIFDRARKSGLRILLDLHALPGSQNGEMHAGISQSEPHFNTDWNKDIAVEAVRNMASFAKSHLDVLYGIQVINEPNHYDKKQRHPFGHQRSFRSLHAFLESYYREAILAARESLLPPVPILVFEWTYNFDQWKDHIFDYTTYGNVIFDTHIYQNGFSDPESARVLYDADLRKLMHFHERQSELVGEVMVGGVVVGEWALAGSDRELNMKNQELAVWLTGRFAECSVGSIFWTWDAPNPVWSMKGAGTNFKIDWKALKQQIDNGTSRLNISSD